MRGAGVLLLLALLCVLGFGVLWSGAFQDSGPSLAERIEAACGANASPIDFTSGGELGGATVGGVVLVTCESRKANRYGQYRTFKRVVQR